MNTIVELHQLMWELIQEEIKSKAPNFTDRAKKIINEIADYGRNTEAYKFNAGLREQFWKDNADATADEVYGFLLDRIVRAPTKFYRDCSIVLIMPKLDELVNGTEATT